MLQFAQSLPVGNAVLLVLKPPAGADEWRLLRKPANTFGDYDDPEAYTAPIPDKSTIDVFGLVNGVEVWYRPYYRILGIWSGDEAVSVTPNANFEDVSADPFGVLRERLDLGLQIYIQRGDLNHPLNRIPVLTASPRIEEVSLPVVSLHVDVDAPEDRGIGEILDQDEYDGTDTTSAEGWLASMQIKIVGWCLNADERKAIREAIRSIVIANLPILENEGIQQVEITLNDLDDMESYAAPMYMAHGIFKCIYPVVVTGKTPGISVVNTNLEVRQWQN